METQERLARVGREVFPLLEGYLLAQKKKPVFHAQSYAPAPPRDRTVLQAPLGNEADGNIEFKTHTYTVYKPAFQVQSYGPVPPYGPKNGAIDIGGNMELNRQTYTVHKRQTLVSMYQISR